MRRPTDGRARRPARSIPLRVRRKLGTELQSSDRRGREISTGSTETLEAIIRGLVEFERQQEVLTDEENARSQGPCRERAIPPPHKGGDKDHTAYATQVSGSESDFEISAPGGPKCAFDGRDTTNPRIVWEVKTRHEWSTPQGIASDIFNPNIQHAIMNMESQPARCASVAKRCGYEYWWAFENKDAADMLALLWSGRVKVVHRPRLGPGG